jgi:hypothetical protein
MESRHLHCNSRATSQACVQNTTHDSILDHRELSVSCPDVISCKTHSRSKLEIQSQEQIIVYVCGGPSSIGWSSVSGLCLLEIRGSSSESAQGPACGLCYDLGFGSGTIVTRDRVATVVSSSYIKRDLAIHLDTRRINYPEEGLFMHPIARLQKQLHSLRRLPQYVLNICIASQSWSRVNCVYCKHHHPGSLDSRPSIHLETRLFRD